MTRPGPSPALLTALSVVLWLAALVHHIDDLIADDYLGGTAWFAVRTVAVLAVHILATGWARDGRRAGYLVLGLVALWWFVTVFLAHAAAVTRSLHVIAAGEPQGWAPVFLAAVFVGGASALATAVVCVRGLTADRSTAKAASSSSAAAG